MKLFNRIWRYLVIGLLCVFILSQTAFAAQFSSLWKLSGTTVQLLRSTWDVYIPTLTVDTLSFGVAATGNIDLDGQALIWNADGDMTTQATGDVQVTDGVLGSQYIWNIATVSAATIDVDGLYLRDNIDVDGFAEIAGTMDVDGLATFDGGIELNGNDLIFSSTGPTKMEDAGGGLLNVELDGGTGQMLIGDGTYAFAESPMLGVEGIVEVQDTFFAKADLNADGTVILGSGGDTVEVNSSSWDVSTIGGMTGVTFDASLNTVSNIANTMLVDDTIDFDKIIDAASLDAAFSITGGMGEAFTINRSLTDGAAENGVTLEFVASDTLPSTTSQFGLYLDNLASTEGLDSMLVLDNSDADDAVVSAIKFVDGGGGFTDLFDVVGTLISGGEFTILDGGIELGELTDVGTLTSSTQTILSRNVADATTAVTITQTHASSTGDILSLANDVQTVWDWDQDGDVNITPEGANLFTWKMVDQGAGNDLTGHSTDFYCGGASGSSTTGDDGGSCGFYAGAGLGSGNNNGGSFDFYLPEGSGIGKAGTFQIHQAGGTPGTDTLQLSHDGTDGIFNNLDTGGYIFRQDATTYLTLGADSSATLGGRLYTPQGSNVASANDITLGDDGNSWLITGTTQVNRIATASWVAGSRFILKFDDALTVKDAQAAGGGFGSILMTGSGDYDSATDSLLECFYDGTDFSCWPIFAE